MADPYLTFTRTRSLDLLHSDDSTSEVGNREKQAPHHDNIGTQLKFEERTPPAFEGPEPVDPETSSTGNSMNSLNKPPPPLLALPAELIQQILCSLSPLDLSRVSQTCRLLYQHTIDENLWKPIVLSQTPGNTLKGYRPPSWRRLFATHHPYWFLTRHKLWFSDSDHTGKLLLAQYNHRDQAIEAHSVTAERAHHGFDLWEWNREVIIHTFSPRVQLDLKSPVIRLDENAYRRASGLGNYLQKEIMMDVHTHHSSHGIYSMFMLSRPCPAEIISPGTKVWPPLNIPAPERTRNESINRYRGTGHKPAKLSEVSETTWRYRKWMEFTHQPAGISMRVGEDVKTFATVDEALYTPTKKKPWRGIWCGDYAGHGCEFLLIMQPDEPGPLPEGALRAITRRSGSVSSADSWTSAQGHVESAMGWDSVETGGNMDSMETSMSTIGESSGVFEEQQTAVKEDVYTGRIEAIKLTGDPNIPRGEYTFIAPDIGPGGLVRIAEEEIFRGARVVKSVGHIAARDFREDEFIPSQLIMISQDRLAQYWEPFGHISFYQRVDLDALLRS